MKNRNRIFIIGAILLSCIIISIVKLSKDLVRIKTDWESTFIDRKRFFKSFSFSGRVIYKTFPENVILPYSLTIKLDTNTFIPQWGDRFFSYIL